MKVFVRRGVGVNLLPNVMQIGVPQAEIDMVDHYADIALNEARQLIAVRTGAAKSTLRKESRGQNERLVSAGGPAAPYVGFLEYGTRFMSAQPFMRPAAAKAATSPPPANINVVP